MIISQEDIYLTNDHYLFMESTVPLRGMIVCIVLIDLPSLTGCAMPIGFHLDLTEIMYRIRITLFYLHRFAGAYCAYTSVVTTHTYLLVRKGSWSSSSPDLYLLIVLYCWLWII